MKNVQKEHAKTVHDAAIKVGAARASAHSAQHAPKVPESSASAAQAVVPPPAAATPVTAPSAGSSSGATSLPLTTSEATPAASFVEPPPTTPMPVPPAGFVAASPKEFQPYRPRAAQVAAAGLVVTELQSFADYATRMGPHAPAPSSVASAVELASAWRLVRTATETWLSYVENEDGLAWMNALVLLRQLEPLFQAAATTDPTLLTTYPGLARTFGASKVIAKSVTATKKKNAKKKAAEAVTNAVNAALVNAGVATTAATSTPNEATGAANTATTGASPAARVVTVTG